MSTLNSTQTRFIAGALSAILIACQGTAFSAETTGKAIEAPPTVIKLPPVVVTAEKDPLPSVIFSEVDVDTKPRLTSQAAPRYAAGLHNQGIGAKVTVQFVVDEKGVPRDVRATAGSVFDSFKNTDVDRALIEGMVKRNALPPVALQMSIDEVRMGIVVEFGKEAESAVRQWRYQPGRKDGKPVAVRLEIPVSFLTRSR